jgi:putative oxidoreductase
MLSARLAPLFSDRAQVPPLLGSVVSVWVRGVIASVLLPFFVTSFLTKIDGFGLSVGAFAQILPKFMAQVGYDPSAVPWPLYLVVVAGTLAEIALPVLVVAGVATRLSALGMIGFVVVMSLTDIFGHDADPQTIGALFDADPYAVILDQRLMWVTLLATLIVTGGGVLSVDGLVSRMVRGGSDQG